MSDTFAMVCLRRELLNQKQYLTVARDQLLGCKRKMDDAQAEKDRRQVYVDQLEDAIKALEGDSDA